MASFIEKSKKWAVLVPLIDEFKREFVSDYIKTIKLVKVDEEVAENYEINECDIAEKFYELPNRAIQQQKRGITDFVKKRMSCEKVPHMVLCAFEIKLYQFKRIVKEIFEEETGFKLPLKGYKIEND
jgi:hypothetical protein